MRRASEGVQLHTFWNRESRGEPWGVRCHVSLQRGLDFTCITYWALSKISLQEKVSVVRERGKKGRERGRERERENRNLVLKKSTDN